MRIGIDMMGGDFAPGSTIRGSILARKELPEHVKIVLVGDQDIFRQTLESNQLDGGDLEVIHTPDSIGMDDHPLKSFKENTRASLFLGHQLLADGSLDGFCSAGNTGAMLVAAMQVINGIPGIIRPAIAAPIPNIHGNPTLMLDVGLNPDARPDVLYQYGTIGTIYSRLVHGITQPGVALLNIGMEEDKGNLVARSAHQLMKETPDFHFIGNMEANELLVTERAQVVVTDGFVGNVVLKQTEGLYRMVKEKGIGNDYFETFNFEKYGGTPVLGINAPLLIGHGISNDKAIRSMLLHTAEVVEAGLVTKIKEALER